MLNIANYFLEGVPIEFDYLSQVGFPAQLREVQVVSVAGGAGHADQEAGQGGRYQCGGGGGAPVPDLGAEHPGADQHARPGQHSQCPEEEVTIPRRHPGENSMDVVSLYEPKYDPRSRSCIPSPWAGRDTRSSARPSLRRAATTQTPRGRAAPRPGAPSRATPSRPSQPAPPTSPTQVFNV